MENSEASKKDLLALISSLPCQLSAEDVTDFFSLAQYYASRTPQSFRKVNTNVLQYMHSVHVSFQLNTLYPK